MTLLDERGEPVVAERVGPRRYLTSGWSGGVGRYATGTTVEVALWAWSVGLFLPVRVRGGASDERPEEVEE